MKIKKMKKTYMKNEKNIRKWETTNRSQELKLAEKMRSLFSQVLGS